MKLKKILAVSALFILMMQAGSAVSASTHYKGFQRPNNISSRAMGYATSGSLWSSIKHAFGW
ncbi:hypothetical protein ACVQ8P_06600 [Dellaglioa sp. BT-FLS60]